MSNGKDSRKLGSRELLEEFFHVAQWNAGKIIAGAGPEARLAVELSAKKYLIENAARLGLKAAEDIGYLKETLLDYTLNFLGGGLKGF